MRALFVPMPLFTSGGQRDPKNILWRLETPQFCLWSLFLILDSTKTQVLLKKRPHVEKSSFFRHEDRLTRQESVKR